MPPKKWKQLSRETVFDHPRMRLVEDVVLLPDGNQTRYLLQAPAEHDSVAVIAINTLTQLLLQREYNYPPDSILWQLPGGSVRKDESLIAAASRELSEESGLIAHDCQVIGYYYTNNRRSDEKQYVVVCEDLEPQFQTADPEEFIESRWIELETVNAMVADNTIKNINLLAALQLWAQYKQLQPKTKP